MSDWLGAPERKPRGEDRDVRPLNYHPFLSPSLVRRKRDFPHRQALDARNPPNSVAHETRRWRLDGQRTKSAPVEPVVYESKENDTKTCTDGTGVLRTVSQPLFEKELDTYEIDGPSAVIRCVRFDHSLVDSKPASVADRNCPTVFKRAFDWAHMCSDKTHAVLLAISNALESQGGSGAQAQRALLHVMQHRVTVLRKYAPERCQSQPQRKTNGVEINDPQSKPANIDEVEIAGHRLITQQVTERLFDQTEELVRQRARDCERMESFLLRDHSKTPEECTSSNDRDAIDGLETSMEASMNEEEEALRIEVECRVAERDALLDLVKAQENRKNDAIDTRERLRCEIDVSRDAVLTAVKREWEVMCDTYMLDPVDIDNTFDLTLCEEAETCATQTNPRDLYKEWTSRPDQDSVICLLQQMRTRVEYAQDALAALAEKSRRVEHQIQKRLETKHVRERVDLIQTPDSPQGGMPRGTFDENERFKETEQQIVDTATIQLVQQTNERLKAQRTLLESQLATFSSQQPLDTTTQHHHHLKSHVSPLLRTTAAEIHREHQRATRRAQKQRAQHEEAIYRRELSESKAIAALQLVLHPIENERIAMMASELVLASCHACHDTIHPCGDEDEAAAIDVLVSVGLVKRCPTTGLFRLL